MVPANAPPALVEVAQRYAQTSRGVVTFQMHRVFDAHAGFAKRHEDLVLNGVYDDGALVRVRVLSYSLDGKVASATDIANVEASWNHPNPSDVFAPPFDARNFDAYQYRSDGPSTIDFFSTVHDAGHGNGSFMYDAQDNVVSYTYQPNVMPPHASSGEITDRLAEMLPGYWAAAHEVQEYHGSVGPFGGSGTIEIAYSDFRRFADLESALRALAL
ncbi:MAG: hypothetical protein JOZ77_11935 [Candidatus Eremiobacteraeota bacterium]|nr:hypothetical protein [Candidatus Eremiobacteraeota bacterium]